MRRSTGDREERETASRTSRARSEGSSHGVGGSAMVQSLQDTLQSQPRGAGGGVGELPLRQFNLEKVHPSFCFSLLLLFLLRFSLECVIAFVDGAFEQVADQLGLRTEDLVGALQSAQDSAPTSSAVVDSGSSITYELEQSDPNQPSNEVTALEGSFDTPAVRRSEHDRAGSSARAATDQQQQQPPQPQQPAGTMAIAFPPSAEDTGSASAASSYSARFRSDPSTWAEEDGRRTSGRGRKVVRGKGGVALPVRRATTTDSLRATMDEQHTSVDEPPERVPEGEELSQPLLSNRSLHHPHEGDVEAQTASLAPGAETDSERHLPVLNIPHTDSHGVLKAAGESAPAATQVPEDQQQAQFRASVPKGYLVGYPRASDDDRGSEGEVPQNEYLFAVPRGDASGGFWDNPLPSGVSDVNFDIGPKPGTGTDDSDAELQFNVTVTRKTPLIGWFMLVGALLAVSFTGLAIKSQHGPSALMKCTWRSQATSLFVIPLALFFVWKDGLLHKPFLRYQMYQACLASMGYLIFNGTFLWALDHTSSAHGFLLNNLHSVLIVVYRAVIGNPVQLLEAVGAVVGLTGATLVCLDSQFSSPEEKGDATWSGDLVAAIGSAFGAVYFVSAKETRPKLNISIFALICHLSNLPFFIAFTYIDAYFLPHLSPWPTLDRDPSSGLFGWMTKKQIPSELAISLVSTLMGTTGYVLVMRYVEPLAISVVTLLEPVVAAAIGVLLAGEMIPGSLTMFGAVTLLAGTVMVLRCERGSETRTDISDQAKKVVASQAASEQ